MSCEKTQGTQCDKLKKQNQGHVRRLKALNDKLKKQNQGHVRRLKALNVIS